MPLHAKPPPGCELNKPARVTLRGVWPEGGVSAAAFAEELREYCASAPDMQGATFISYLPATGAWTFAVPHFSRWGRATGGGARVKRAREGEAAGAAGEGGTSHGPPPFPLGPAGRAGEQ